MKNYSLFNYQRKYFIYLLLIILMITPFFSLSAQQNENTEEEQNFIEYKGIVKDSDSKKSLGFVNINIVGSNIGTITNTEGEFSLKVSIYLQEVTIRVSHLGYKGKDISTSSFDEKKSITIALEPDTIELSTVSIYAFKDAKTLVKAMLNREGQSYTKDKTLMTAFYRETIKKRNKNASLSEAVVEIHKQPYSSLKNDRINLIKARKSVNYSKLDTLAIKLQGGPFSALYNDILKYREFIFTENDLKDYDFDFEEPSRVNNQDVYVISFKQKSDIYEPLYYGKLYINEESIALVSAIYNLNVENSELASELFVRKKPRKVAVTPINANYRVDYRIKDGLWYYGYSSISLTFKVNWENRLFNSLYTLQSEMAVTDWENSTNLEDPKNFLRPSVILSEEASGFSDPKFWGEYNIIEPEKSIEKAIEKINKQLAKN